MAGVLARHYPEASLFTSAHRTDAVPLDAVGGRPWRTSFLQPLVPYSGLKATLPLLPAAMASLPTRDYELLLTSSSAFGHHAQKGPGALHVCVCHTPPRFLWQSDEYFRGRRAMKASLEPLLKLLRSLDLRAACRVDAYIAVSRHVAARIRKTYGREATVVYPPVDISMFEPSLERSGRFLVVSRLVRSKRVDLVIAAANHAGLPLDVIGTGPELASLKRLAGSSVRLLGRLPDTAVRDAMARCEAIVVAGEEDFGLVMVEAQASGRPPVAVAAGGALEIVDDGVTGYLFADQRPSVIAGAMLRARAGRLGTDALLASARRFDLPSYFGRLDAVVAAAVARRASMGIEADAMAPEAAS